ncbi:3',5'-cyclic-nucleotide phosphodiesterase [Apophysomyces ossiformis]|uniref:Phosphodiesterase n=1 Tax=Apophysomyces ossiformis TaxID=679940 RepID=A0A8H7EPC4_9FUNG|nr:3',5'-cyclic-nucleotide phosphodiesterase [Apophysomyces ossiformis]
MEPEQCSVIYIANTSEYHESLDVLRSVFKDGKIANLKRPLIHGFFHIHPLQPVSLASNNPRIVSTLQSRNTPTLVLFDIDNHNHNHTTHPNLELLRTVVEISREGRLRNIVPIVCSTSDSPEFMVKCLRYGAADYLLKPLREDVVKTMFLNAYRYQAGQHQQQQQQQQQAKQGTSGSALRRASQATGEMWAHFQDRIKAVFSKENNWLSQTVVDYYAPLPSIRRSSMSSVPSDRIRSLREEICSWDFRPLELDDKNLIQCVYMIFEQVLSLPGLESFCISGDNMYNFILDIFNAYHNTNPYHNFRHAVDVLQATYYMLCMSGSLIPMNKTTKASGEILSPSAPSKDIHELLRPIDILALLMASIGHDIGHPGVNNMFMINTSTPLAILYNDRSVLESFHSMAFFHLFHKNCLNYMKDFRQHPHYGAFRQTVVHCILATDMGLHSDYVNKIKEQAQQIRENTLDLEDPAVCERHRLTLCTALIKCADISNVARPFASAKKWAQTLAEEFFKQGDLEKELGMPVTATNERGKVPLEDFQLTFMRQMALDLYESVQTILPGKYLNPLPKVQFCT